MRRRIPAWLVEPLVILVAGVDIVYSLYSGNEHYDIVWAVVGVAALTLRRRWPWIAFLPTLPGALVLGQSAASLIALYTVANTTRRRGWLGAAVLVLGLCYIWPVPLDDTEYLTDSLTVVTFVYSLALAAAPAFLGQLVQTKRDLSDRLDEITEAREHERLLITQTALAAERAQLAREMHDVVSHQVSLIAVRAAAWQVSTGDPESKEAAATIRQLSTRTLDELRHMVSVLRAAGSKPTELTPQPGVDDLEQLVASSAIDATLSAEPLPDVDAAVERAIYRTVQEALTNVRKHAPGATATVRVFTEGDTIEVSVTNTAATRAVVALPSAEQGLLGLRQRAELLDGSLDYGPTDAGGWTLRLRLPGHGWQAGR
ncbi:sensor histidine kinase [Stackebrandtia nassauensis]|uniref:histidine kinase n=1 Tax=Stackebrandtia nassauensis (strain DSM 44728 / CIP 108903 / NRRL B-16338 / NBRC 102104 / LLR-40K-21) TaxID=446470 RepID=D3PUH6_STANL|nr:histidine kinase [Stackebrandtia nassauensis]ADD42989.1 histidine kinase [Stackebrandtia nassauensis DSM 44728]